MKFSSNKTSDRTEKKFETAAFAMSLSGVLECPVCNSQEVRVSLSRPVYEFFYRWQGLQRYRCRDCRSVFRMPLRPGEGLAQKPARRRRSHRIRRFRSRMPGWQRKTVEAMFFLLLVFAFYTMLKNIGFSL